MDYTALYMLTHVRAIVHLYESGLMTPDDCFRQIHIVQMKVRDTIDNPDNTLDVPQGTRELCSALHKELFPYGENPTCAQRMMLISIFIKDEIERCVGSKFIWPHTYTAEQLQMLGFMPTKREGFYQIPYYVIDHLSRDTLLFFMDGNYTTTIERSEPPTGYGPDQSGMIPLGMWAVGHMPQDHKHHFFLEQ